MQHQRSQQFAALHFPALADRPENMWTSTVFAKLNVCALILIYVWGQSGSPSQCTFPKIVGHGMHVKKTHNLSQSSVNEAN
jgi:hypothetical protein